MSFSFRKHGTILSVLAASLLWAPSAFAQAQPHSAANDPATSLVPNTTSLTQNLYLANENAGQFPITIQRSTDLSQPEVDLLRGDIQGLAGRSELR